MSQWIGYRGIHRCRRLVYSRWPACRSRKAPKTALYYGIAGMAIALFATIFSENTAGLGWVIIAMAIGGAVGIYKARKSGND